MTTNNTMYYLYLYLKPFFLFSVKSNDNSDDADPPRLTSEDRTAPVPLAEQHEPEATSHIPATVPIHQQIPKTPERPPDTRNVIQYSPSFLCSQVFLLIKIWFTRSRGFYSFLSFEGVVSFFQELFMVLNNRAKWSSIPWLIE